MLFRLSSSVIYDTIRAHAAMRAADAQKEGVPGADLDIFLSPERTGLVAILIKNSFARLVGRLPKGLVTASSIGDEQADSDPGEEAMTASEEDVELTAELAIGSETNAAAMRRSLEQAVAMDVLACYAALRREATAAAEYRALVDVDMAAIEADVTPVRPFLRPRWVC